MTINPIISLGLFIGLAVIAFSVAFALIRSRYPKKHRLWPVLRLISILLCLFMINLRIMVPGSQVDIEMKNADVLFVLDTTISMWAVDGEDSHSSTRFEVAVEDCRKIMDALNGSHFALITLDNTALIRAPFTQDADNIDSALESLTQPDCHYATGSTPAVAHDAMEKLLRSSAAKENRLTYVFFLSDGEITSDEGSVFSFADLAGYIDGGAVLGYGTQEGATMRDLHRYAFRFQDPVTGEDAVSRMDESVLGQIAIDLDIRYIHEAGDDEYGYVVSDVYSKASSLTRQLSLQTMDDTYFPWMVLLFVCLLWEIISLIRSDVFMSETIPSVRK